MSIRGSGLRSEIIASGRGAPVDNPAALAAIRVGNGRQQIPTWVRQSRIDPYSEITDRGDIITGDLFVALGEDLPDIALPDLNSEWHSFTEYRGQKLLVFMWASW